MSWHSAPDRLDEPRACCFDGSGAGKGCPLVDGAHGAEFRTGIPEGRRISPTRAAKPAAVKMLRRRGGRVVEGARLESVFTGNRNAGSNPALSAIKEFPP